jgi:hypothetical protein
MTWGLFGYSLWTEVAEFHASPMARCAACSFGKPAPNVTFGGADAVTIVWPTKTPPAKIAVITMEPHTSLLFVIGKPPATKITGQGEGLATLFFLFPQSASISTERSAKLHHRRQSGQNSIFPVVSG